MANLDISEHEIAQQGRANESAFWHLALHWARVQTGSVDGWATYVGEQFAPGWDEMGSPASALAVARQAGVNHATTADTRPVDLTGDEARAVLTVEGPDQEWLDEYGTTVEDHDRANELIFRAIAERRGLTLTLERDGTVSRLTFAKA